MQLHAMSSTVAPYNTSGRAQRCATHLVTTRTIIDSARAFSTSHCWLKKIFQMLQRWRHGIAILAFFFFIVVIMRRERRSVLAA
jgi:hypothetical protein